MVSKIWLMMFQNLLLLTKKRGCRPIILLCDTVTIYMMQNSHRVSPRYHKNTVTFELLD